MVKKAAWQQGVQLCNSPIWHGELKQRVPRPSTKFRHTPIRTLDGNQALYGHQGWGGGVGDSIVECGDQAVTENIET